MPAPQGFLDRPAGTFAAGSPERPASWVVDFKDGSREMRDLLGGKGANVAEMTRILGPERVPAGFTITTEACVAYMDGEEFPAGLDDQVAAALARLEELAGKRLGDPADRRYTLATDACAHPRNQRD